MKIIAVVLAAGEGRRMGRPKALLPLGSETFLSHVCRRLARPGVASVVAVIGAEAGRVLSASVLPAGVIVVENEGWAKGMLSSVWRGLEVAESLRAEAILLHPVDHPLVAPETVDGVVRALEGGAFAAVPTHGGRRGHPGGFGREAFAALRAAPLDVGARHILAAHPERVVHVTGDPGCRLGIDTPEDYRRALRVPPPPQGGD